jgi:hypothetical protein
VGEGNQHFQLWVGAVAIAFEGSKNRLKVDLLRVASGLPWECLGEKCQ